MFNEEIGVPYIFNAHKPAGKNYRRAMQLMGTDRNTTLFVGDQVIYGMYGGKAVRYPQYPRPADSSERGNPDCSEAISGENRTSFLSEEEKETCIKTCPGEAHWKTVLKIA